MTWFIDSPILQLLYVKLIYVSPLLKDGRNFSHSDQTFKIYGHPFISTLEDDFKGIMKGATNALDTLLGDAVSHGINFVT